MKYHKPEVTIVEKALGAIQGTMKPGITFTDSVLHQPNDSASAGAYEADE